MSRVARLVAARLAEVVPVRAQTHHLPALAATSTLLPRAQPPAQVVGVDVQDVADVLEREQPGAIGILDPRLRLLEELLAAGIAGLGLLAIDVDRVLEHGDHEPTLAVVLGPSPHAIEELRRQERVGLEDHPEPLVDCVFTFLHRELTLTPSIAEGIARRRWRVPTTVP